MITGLEKASRVFVYWKTMWFKVEHFIILKWILLGKSAQVAMRISLFSIQTVLDRKMNATASGKHTCTEMRH